MIDCSDNDVGNAVGAHEIVVCRCEENREFRLQREVVVVRCLMKRRRILLGRNIQALWLSHFSWRLPVTCVPSSGADLAMFCGGCARSGGPGTGD